MYAVEGCLDHQWCADAIFARSIPKIIVCSNVPTSSHSLKANRLEPYAYLKMRSADVTTANTVNDNQRSFLFNQSVSNRMTA